jgi:hypothetical protein
MPGAAVLVHLLDLIHGITAFAACVVLFYVAGLLLLPRRSGQAFVPGECPAFLGAALFVLVCWFAVRFNVALAPAAIGFALAVSAGALARVRWVVSACRARIGRATIRWAGAFALLYVLIYLFITPSIDTGFLPPAWLGNIDLLTYARYTKYLLHLGPSNLPYPDSSYIDLVYTHTPAVFYLLAIQSFFFRLDPLTAAMPAAFSYAALLGVVSARVCRSVFRLSRGAALAIAAVLISGPFFRYIAGEYFLSTLMSAPVAVYLVWVTVEQRSKRLVDPDAIVVFGSAYVLLMFLYPVMLAVALAAQAGALVLMRLAEWSAPGKPAEPAGARAASRDLSAFAGFAIVAAALWARTSWSFTHLSYLSQRNVNGWTLELLSPLAVLGFPAAWFAPDRCPFCLRLELAGAGGTAAALFAALAVGLGAAYFWKCRSSATAAERTLVTIAAGSFATYYGFFFLTGVSYQQWKFASYSAMPWSFVLLAAVAAESGRRVTIDGHDRRAHGMAASLAWSAAAVALVGGNLFAHARADPPPTQLAAGLLNVSAVNAMPGFREVTVMMDEGTDGLASWMALYLLPDKLVHVISQRNVPNEPLSYDTVSRQRPLLVQNLGCDGVGHSEVADVPVVGCLLFGPPSLAFDTPYPFSQSYAFVTATGLGQREPVGRWNADGTVTLTLLADIKRVHLFDDVAVNLRVTPYLPPGIARQRLHITWGTNHRADVTFTEPRTVSLAVRRTDWSGTRMWRLPISIALPDRIAPPWMYAPKGLTDGPPLAAIFESVSIGRAIEGGTLVQ